MKIKYMFIIPLLTALIATCNKEHLPDFVFDADGICQAQGLKAISEEDFDRYVAGYGWSVASISEVNYDGSCSDKDFFETRPETVPSQFYFESASSLKEYVWLKDYQEMCYLLHDYIYKVADGENAVLNGVITGGNRLMQIISVNDDVMEALVLLDVADGDPRIYGYVVYNKMSDSELQSIDGDAKVNLSDLRSIELSVKDEVVIVPGDEFSFDVLYSNGPCTFKALRDGSCEITSEGNHVNVKILTNGVSLEGSDYVMHCGIDIFSTSADFTPEGNDAYYIDFPEVILAGDGRLLTASGDDLHYDISWLSFHANMEYGGYQYTPVALLAIDESRNGRYMRLNGGKIKYSDLLPDELLDEVAAGGDGNSVALELQLIGADCNVFQSIPFKVTFEASSVLVE